MCFQRKLFSLGWSLGIGILEIVSQDTYSFVGLGLNLYLSLAHLFGDRAIGIQVQQKLARQVSLPARLQGIEKAFTNRTLWLRS